MYFKSAELILIVIYSRLMRLIQRQITLFEKSIRKMCRFVPVCRDIFIYVKLSPKRGMSRNVANRTSTAILLIICVSHREIVIILRIKKEFFWRHELHLLRNDLIVKHRNLTAAYDNYISFVLIAHRALTVGHDYLLWLCQRLCSLIDTCSSCITTYIIYSSRSISFVANLSKYSTSTQLLAHIY